MAKIITPGRPQKGWSIETKCTGKGNGNGGCGAILLIEQDDLFHTQSHARDETTDYVTFQCPACNVWTDLSSDYDRTNAPPSSVVSGLLLRSPSTIKQTHAEWLRSCKKNEK